MAGALALSLGLAAMTPGVAQACGGCFSMPPPGPTMVQTVTYHRMALSASTTQTTLWDQFGYAGRAEEFSWILPIQGGPDVRVELADVRFLAALDNTTAATFGPIPQAPSRMCASCYTPPPEVEYYCEDEAYGGARADGGFGFADASASADSSSPPSADSGVSVLREETVGPYETVVIRGTDAGALRAWLTEHRYVVPASMEPVIEHYIALRMDFVALRLSDMAGVGSMQPVRVVAPGYQPLLPLRMVAAGIGDSVELVLFTLADSRLEAQNYPNVAIRNDDLTWNYASGTTPLAALRAQERLLRSRNDGRAWLTESARTTSTGELQVIADNANSMFIGEGDSGGPMVDMTVALTGLGPRPVLTRMHADLNISKLDRDLMLSASTAGEQGTNYEFARMEDTPSPPECPVLSCSSGLVIGGEGQIIDPFGQIVAPDARVSGTYERGSLGGYTPRYQPWLPRYSDGRPYSPRTTRRERRCTGSATGGATCTVGPATGRASMPRTRVAAALGIALAGLCAGAASRSRKRRKSEHPEA